MSRHASAPRVLIWACILLFAVSAAAVCQESRVLKNSKVTAQFDEHGLVSIAANGRTVQFKGDAGAITIDGQTTDTSTMTPSGVEQTDNTLIYKFGADLKVIYELKPAWGFVSKQLVYSKGSGAQYRVDTVKMIGTELGNAIAGEQRISGGGYGAFLRFAEDGQPTWGMLFAIQNPFNTWEYTGRNVALSYQPDMPWKSEWGPFESDRLLLAPYVLSGTQYSARSIPEWRYVPEGSDPSADTGYGRSPTGPAGKIDKSEIETFQGCVRAFLLFHSEKSMRIDVGWCENDYQIDCGTPEGRTEYKRIIDQAANIGCGYILYAPGNSKVSSQQESRDAWGWENLLWLGMGQKIRKGEWDPKTGPIDPSIQEMLDYAKSKNIKLVAYAYPSVPYMQDPEWTRWTRNPGGYSTVDTGLRSFQDWFVGKLVDFQKRTGIGGYSFDHWWIAYGSNPNSEYKVSSKYAQWYGCRRILSELRKAVPDIIVDGRQQYCWFGPWTLVAGTYPHPFGGDEQPGSFRARADLHTDRLSANHVRNVNWNFRMQSFLPVEITPGYFTHQTQRSDEKGVMRRDPWRRADWDYLGWKYSVISSLATAPLNHVANFLPARDTAEFAAFSKQDQQWLKGWLDWTDKNMDILRNVQFIIGPCGIGKVDGTAAFKKDKGYVFLFNSNYRKLDAQFKLDSSIGLNAGSEFVITELYPQAGRSIGKPDSGTWKLGDSFSLRMEGNTAVVLSVAPASGITQPMLFNSTGKAALTGTKLALTGVTGEIGSTSSLIVALPQAKSITSVTVNGKKVKFTQKGRAVSMDVAFAGTQFSACQQVGIYDPKFEGTKFKGEFLIPSRIIAQLKARKQAWPVNYTADDLRAPWIGPDRLFLFVNIPEFDSKAQVSMTIDGKPYELKQAYNGIYPTGNQTYIGWYADVASLKPDTKHQVEVAIPEGLRPGQFQGLYFDNVETEYTQALAK